MLIPKFQIRVIVTLLTIAVLFFMAANIKSCKDRIVLERQEAKETCNVSWVKATRVGWNYKLCGKST